MKYRKISPCIWNDAKVRELSDKGKLALLFLLTHPHMTPLGAIRANAATCCRSTPKSLKNWKRSPNGTVRSWATT